MEDLCRTGCGRQARASELELCTYCYDTVRRARQRHVVRGTVTSHQAKVLGKLGRPSRAMLVRMPWLDELRKAPVHDLNMFRRRSKKRGAQAYEMRIQEQMTWRSIAEHLGYATHNSAIKAAATYADRQGLDWPIDTTKERRHA